MLSQTVSVTEMAAKIEDKNKYRDAPSRRPLLSCCLRAYVSYSLPAACAGKKNRRHGGEATERKDRKRLLEGVKIKSS